MKKIYQFIVILIVCLLVTPVSITKAKPKTVIISLKMLYIPELPVPIQPFIEKGRTMVPLRTISEEFEIKNEWDNSTKQIRFTDQNIVIEMMINSNTAKVNGQEKQTDVPVLIRNNRTFIPIRFLMEAFGATVSWDPVYYEITIVYEIPDKTLSKANVNPQMEPIQDPTPPIVEIYTPADQSETAMSKIQVKGKVSDPESGIANLEIKGTASNIQEMDGVFTFDWSLAKNTNTISIIVTNGAGLATTKTITVYCKTPNDSTPPLIEFISPLENSETKEISIHVKGKVSDLESGIASINIIGDTINRQENNDIFEFDWILKEDKNTVDVVATNGAGLKTTKRLTVYKKPADIIGPKTVIELWIGRKTATIDGTSWVLDVPPQILKGRTVVPIRFIAEAFRFKVVYEAMDQSITITSGTTMVYLQINNTEATVSLIEDGKPKIKFVMLETPPIIQKGRTLVPVRFIAEAFGARVDWSSKEQKITITMKK
jgi:hypothetical protein